MDISYLGAGLALGLAIGIGSTKRTAKTLIYKRILNFCTENNIKILKNSKEVPVNDFIKDLDSK